MNMKKFADVNQLAAMPTDQNGNLVFAPEISTLESAMSFLTPNCEDRTTAVYRVSPLVDAAIMFPDLAVALKNLGRRWYSGELQGKAAKGWTAVGRHGLTGEQYFENLWNHFSTRTAYKGKKTTLGSIYFHAKAAGWVYEPTDETDAGE